VHNALGSGPLASALSRAVGDSVGPSGLERYGETLTPELDLWGQPEWAYLRREVLLGTRIFQAAVAGEFGGAAVINPDASGLLVVVERASAMAAPQTLFNLGRAPSALVLATYASVARGLARDTRWNIGPGLANTAGQSLAAFGTDAAAVGALFASVVSGAGTFADFSVGLPIILHPGQAVVVESITANLAVQIGFSWR
jgi:hypothetical protein